MASFNRINSFQWSLGKLSDAAAAVTVSPMKDLATCIYPPLKAYFENKLELSTDNLWLGKIVEDRSIESIQAEAEKIVRCADLKDGVRIYTTLNAPYEGLKSYFENAMFVPLEDIHQRNFNAVPEEEDLLDSSELKESMWKFSDNEVRFLFARAAGQMSNYSAIKIAARVMIAVLAIGLTFSPFGWIAGLIIFAGAAFLYFAIDWCMERRLDHRAVEILTNRFEGPDRELNATFAAINCLKKIQLRQLEERSYSKLYKFLITEEGNVRFSLLPSLTSRIEKLEERLHDLLSRKVLHASSRFASA